MSMVLSLMGSYCFCEMFAQHKILEILIISIDEAQCMSMADTYDEKSQLILTWIELVEETTMSWPHLWEQMYRESIEILWAILVQFSCHPQICGKIKNLFMNWNYKYQIMACPSEENVLALLNEQHCNPEIIQVIAMNIDQAGKFLLIQFSRGNTPI